MTQLSRLGTLAFRKQLPATIAKAVIQKTENHLRMGSVVKDWPLLLHRCPWRYATAFECRYGRLGLFSAYPVSARK